ncbi:hypothetical protein GF325_10500 [Candidatus Bathyarchaeota archaeon]|nr:hypothetical protein [Candidatus Bathyarchaeota archaeon]
MGRKRARRKKLAMKIGRERINILMNLAEKASISGESDLARRYVFIAKRVAMRIQEPLPWYYKRQTCKECHAFLIPGNNARVRITGNKGNAHVAVSCLECGNIARYHYHRDGKQEKI